ncbi:hypothetical protein JTE90_010275 [Oedothorax gibbosus]|uniref:Microtubule-associated protein n=1 Tax=Oedothorax gibbosus TaxID=931172 RepID=A0AAV6U4Y1_9ARAC|nr:hypothetical protein JTE90_010275 [Oedothorax gibbosus]
MDPYQSTKDLQKVSSRPTRGMETKPQVDSPQKSPVSKTLPPSENKDEAAKKPLPDLEAPSASTSAPTPGTTASNASQKVAEQDSKAESKPEALPSSTEDKHHDPEESNTETSLQHPIISVDIKKSASSETKKEVPQESKTNTSEVPPEVLASVVTTAVVNAAASAVVDSDKGLAISGTKVISDPSKVDSVVEQELNKLSEKIKEEIQLKSKDDVQSDTKPLPNGDIDHSPGKGVADSEKDLKEVANKESECNAQSMEGKEESSKHRNGYKTEACKNTEAVAQNQNNVLHQTQNSEITSSNGVPGIITVVGISKKDSTQNKEAGESTSNSKLDDASETIKETDEATKEGHSKDEGFEKIGSSYKYDDKRELPSVSRSDVDCKEKTKVGENAVGGNLTDSAKIQSSIQKVYDDIDSSQNKQEIADAENPIQNEDSQFKKCESQKTKSTSENEGEKSASQIDIDKDEDTQEKSAEDTKENTAELDKSGNESIPDKTATQVLKTSPEPEEPKEKDNKSDTDSSKKELTSEDNIVSDICKQTQSSDISKSGVTSATSDSSTNIAAPDVEEGTEELCDMSMMASMTTSQILTEEMLNGSSMEQDKNKKNLSLDSETSLKDDQHKIEVCSMASATSGTCDIGVGSDERTMIRCASGDGGEEEVDGEQATTEIEIIEEANAGSISPDRQSAKSPSASSDAAEISQEKPGDAEDKPASAASRTSSIPEATVYEPPERRRSAASSAANEDRRDEDAGDKSKDESEKEEDGDKETSQRDTPVDNNKEASETAVSTEEKVDEGIVLEDHVETTEEGVVNDEKHEKEENNETSEEKEKGAEEDDEKATERPDSKVEQEKTDAEDAETPQSASGGKDEIKEDADESAEKDVTEDSGDTKDGDGVIESSATAEKVDEEQTQEKNVDESESEKVDEEKAVSEVEVDDGKKEAKEEEVPKELEEPKTLVEEEKEVQEEVSEIKDEKDASDSSEKNGGTEEAKNEGEKAEIGGEKEEEKPEIETDRDADAVKDEGEEQPKNEEPPETEEAQEEQSAKEVENAEATPEKADEEAPATQEADNEAEKEADDKELAGGDEAGQTEKQPEEEEEEEKEEPQSPTKRGRSPDKAGRRGVSPISSPPKSLKTPPSPQKPQKATSPKKKNGALSPIKTPKTPASDTRKLPPIKAPVGLAPNPNLKNIRSKIGSFDNIKYKPGGGDKKVISTKKLEWKAAPKIGSLDHSFKGEKKRSRSKDGKDGKAAGDGQSGDEAEPEVTSAETIIKPEGAADMPVAISAES